MDVYAGQVSLLFCLQEYMTGSTGRLLEYRGKQYGCLSVQMIW